MYNSRHFSIRFYNKISFRICCFVIFLLLWSISNIHAQEKNSNYLKDVYGIKNESFHELKPLEFKFWGPTQDSIFVISNLLPKFKKLEFYKTQFKKGIRINSCEGDFLSIRGCGISKLYISPYVDSLEFYFDTIPDLEFMGGKCIKGISLTHCKIGKVKFISTSLSGALNLSNLEIDDKGMIDLTTLTSLNKDRKIKLNLCNTSIDKIMIANYENFILDFDTITNFDTKCAVYTGLMQNFRRQGHEKSYELVDIEYQNFKYLNNKNWYGFFSNYFQKYWWNYGYSKWYIIYWILFLLTFFTIVNLSKYNDLNNKTYSIENFNPIIEGSIIQKIFLRFYYSFIYTAMVFFSINLKLDKLHFENRKKLIWFFTIYITGLICLAYLANFILKTS